MAPMTNLQRLEQLVERLPGTTRVDIEAWGGEPTFRVANKVFVFTSPDARSITVKLTADEAAAVVATDPSASPTGYGMGRHGWISVVIGSRPTAARWREIDEWVRTSYVLVAPKRLSRQLEAETGSASAESVPLSSPDSPSSC
jgi:predicted DNA-binding protein (MmcQ/YjbR family)